MTSAVVLTFGEKEHKISAAGSGTDAVRFFRSLEDLATHAHDKLGVPPGTYDLYDRHGQIRHHGDLLRSLEQAGAGECTVEIREHHQFTRIRGVEAETSVLSNRITQLELKLKQSEENTDLKIGDAKNELKELIRKVDRKVDVEVKPSIEHLNREVLELKRQTKAIQEKLADLNIQEMRELASAAQGLQDALQAAIQRMDSVNEQWQQDKIVMEGGMSNLDEALKELRRYVSGKLDVCIEADADLRRDQQDLDERLQIVRDNLKLLGEDHKALDRHCQGALEQSEELRCTLGQLREDNDDLRRDHGQTRTRMDVMEGRRSEPVVQLARQLAEVQFFRLWHRGAKGPDVQFSADLSVATGRGFLAATGMVLGNCEGLAVADGPCRRFGTHGLWSSYYEVLIDEICAAPETAGGLYVGVAIQTGEEIAAHPRREFDGWLIGGPGKALICRAGYAGGQEPGSMPASWAQAAGSDASATAERAMELLRAALPPRPKGEMREVRSMWQSQKLTKGDKVGVLFRCNREGGARMKISLNGDVVATHEFMEAPPAEAVGFLTPVMRFAGTGKSAKLLPGLTPPSHVLAG